MPPIDSNQVLSQHLTRLMEGSRDSRMELASRMGVSDGTLGRIKYGKANPTLDVLDRIARFYRVPAWSLVKPEEGAGGDPAAPSPEILRLAAKLAALPDEKRKALTVLLAD